MILEKSFQWDATPSLQCNFLTFSFSKVFWRQSWTEMKVRIPVWKSLITFDFNQTFYAFLFFQSFILSFHTLPTIDSSTSQHHTPTKYYWIKPQGNHIENCLSWCNFNMRQIGFPISYKPPITQISWCNFYMWTIWYNCCKPTLIQKTADISNLPCIQ